MLERLTPEHGWQNASYDTWEICGLDYVCQRDCWKPTQCEIPKKLIKLAAYEDSGLSPEEVQELAKAKTEGRLVVLPCKVGDKVYRFCNDAINVGIIRNILFNKNTGEIGLEYEIPECYSCSRSGTLGKNLFLTREEAEKALGVGE